MSKLNFIITPFCYDDVDTRSMFPYNKIDTYAKYTKACIHNELTLGNIPISAELWYLPIVDARDQTTEHRPCHYPPVKSYSCQNHANILKTITDHEDITIVVYMDLGITNIMRSYLNEITSFVNGTKRDIVFKRLYPIENRHYIVLSGAQLKDRKIFSQLIGQHCNVFDDIKIYTDEEYDHSLKYDPKEKVLVIIMFDNFEAIGDLEFRVGKRNMLSIRLYNDKAMCDQESFDEKSYKVDTLLTFNDEDNIAFKQDKIIGLMTLFKLRK
jgi:hypothetical protein